MKKEKPYLWAFLITFLFFNGISAIGWEVENLTGAVLGSFITLVWLFKRKSKS